MRTAIDLVKSACVMVTLTLGFTACTMDSYDKGDSELSYYRSDLVDVHVKGTSIVSMTTDDDDVLLIPDGMKINEKLAHPDTIYRMSLYYTKEEGKPIKLYGNEWVAVIKPVAADSALTLAQDRMDVVAWQARNGRYLNFQLTLKGGETDKKHILDVTEDSVVTETDGTPHHYLTLRHSQNGIPEYYSSTAFLSIPLYIYNKGERITVKAETYQNNFKQTFTVN